MILNKEELEITKEAWVFYYKELLSNIKDNKFNKRYLAELENKKQRVENLINKK